MRCAKKFLTALLALAIAAFAAQASWAVWASADALVKMDIGTANEKMQSDSEYESGAFRAYALASAQLSVGPQIVADAWGRASAKGVYSWLWSKSTSKTEVTYDAHSPKSAVAHAKAGGSTYIVDGPEGHAVGLLVRIPRTGTVADPEYTPLPNAPSQGLYCESFFDVFFEVDTRVDLGGGMTPLIVGSALLQGPSAVHPGLTLTGDLTGADFAVTDFLSPDGQWRKQALLMDDVVSSIFVVPTNTPFEMVYDLTLGGGGQLVTTEGITLCNAADFVVQLELADPSELYTLRAIPEPSGAILLGLLAFVWFARTFRTVPFFASRQRGLSPSP